MPYGPYRVAFVILKENSKWIHHRKGEKICLQI